MSLFF
jgi:hypothetical protein